MKLDIQIERIDDPIVRESFQKLLGFIDSHPLLKGEWRVFELEIANPGSMVPIRHKLPYIPQDVIVLYREGNHQFYFRHELTDKEFLYANVGGACRVRFMAGRIGQ